MKKIGTSLLMAGLIVLSFCSVNAQSKKEIIKKFQFQTDSLKGAGASKDNIIRQLEGQINRLQTVNETAAQNYRSIENKADSLSQILKIKTIAIESLTAEVAKLNTSFASSKSGEKDCTDKIDALQKELEEFKLKKESAQGKPASNSAAPKKKP